ncbi:hypothetical protein PRIPAC_86626 [Pristionchus pacificus]|uniref:Zinc finger protein n=1 Tax=Pristionchus pacificus TaxID=54126 RepID=A0A2A6BLM0_PRIPA|nr:hypothetical protein PRIPAC_86626 [Pristionchus pacificus]|eukprot:PDM66822.1 zinc finger protein [Pristionchus pacificus]
MVTIRRRAYEPGDSKPKRRKTDNESASIRVSRACRICLTEAPRYLSVLTPCGHAICRACSLKIRWDASSGGGQIHCSVCRGGGTFVGMQEELIAVVGGNERTGDESTDSSDPPDREVADEERISASDEDRVLAEAVAARAILPDVSQQSFDAWIASHEAKKKICDAAVAATKAREAIQAGVKEARHARHMARNMLYRSEDAEVRARVTEIIAKIDAVQPELNILQRRAARDEIEAKKKAANAESEPLHVAMEEALRRVEECLMKMELIENLMKRFAGENEDSATRGLRFSRACRACSAQNPPLRSFFPACGHAVCRECADKATSNYSTMVTTRRRANEPYDSKPNRRKTNDNNATVRVSRACRVCVAEEPRCLSVLIPCGHAVCRACSLKIRWDASLGGEPTRCSICRSEGAFVAMVEEAINEGGEQVRQNRRFGPSSSSNPLLSRDREVADEERISTSEEDRVLADAVQASSTLSDVLQQAIDSTEAAMEALEKTRVLSRAAVEAATTVDDVIEATLKLSRAWLAFLEACKSMKRAPTREDIAKNDDDVRQSAEAEPEQLIETKETATRKLEESYAVIGRVKNLIERFQRENVDCAARGLRFSRACRACNTDSPPLRSFFPACGHAVCRGCADRAAASEEDTSCPICHKEGDAIYLFEELAES